MADHPARSVTSRPIQPNCAKPWIPRFSGPRPKEEAVEQMYTAPVGWFSDLVFRFRRRYSPAPLIASATGWVQIEGTVEALELIACPLTGDEAVAVFYQAAVPGGTSSAYGGLVEDFHVSSQARQAQDFLLRDSSGAALIRMDSGPKVADIHAELSRRHGLGLKAQTELLRPGQHVQVRGHVTEPSASVSPHHHGPYAVILDADEVSIIE